MSRKPKTFNYKMRAEAFCDVAGAMAVIPMLPCKVVCESPCMTDSVVTFKSIWSLDELRKGLRKVVDGHVMVETVALAKDYTGDRDDYHGDR